MLGVSPSPNPYPNPGLALTLALTLTLTLDLALALTLTKAITIDGRVFTWGDADGNALGHTNGQCDAPHWLSRLWLG